MSSCACQPSVHVKNNCFHVVCLSVWTQQKQYWNRNHKPYTAIHTQTTELIEITSSRSITGKQLFSLQIYQFLWQLFCRRKQEGMFCSCISHKKRQKMENDLITFMVFQDRNLKQRHPLWFCPKYLTQERTSSIGFTWKKPWKLFSLIKG